MTDKNTNSSRVAALLSVVILTLLVYLPSPAFSQQESPDRVQDLLVNGGFEGGFQDEYGIGYGWGGFSNGNAVVGWNFDNWEPVVVEGQYSQSIEIQEALEQDRYAGIYQTISVVPGEQYKLTINGLIRSDEGDISLSDYGYRLQYAIDYEGDTAWELIEEDAWQEVPWDEQALDDTESGYTVDTYETTITAETDKLTLFIRGWKKWINDGTGIFNIDEVSFVGLAPEGFQAPVAQAAAAGDRAVADAGLSPADVESDAAETETGVMEEAASSTASSMDETASSNEASSNETVSSTGSMAETDAETAPVDTEETVVQNEPAPDLAAAPLPVSGFGDDTSVMYIMITGIAVLLVLFVGAVTATLRRRNISEQG